MKNKLKPCWFCNAKVSKWYRKLARHVNRKALFWSDTWKDGLVDSIQPNSFVLNTPKSFVLTK
jgi:hypothetical protein